MEFAICSHGNLLLSISNDEKRYKKPEYHRACCRDQPYRQKPKSHFDHDLEVRH
ncbi:unnamed protein product [Arabidopsis thaliana]|uniref:(thale cress) hypothetical protein n=1 Tax=Arabidopsis thaliana TaxID=3702 RepID=A0A7G2FMG4_ARATH|nr:unnamed protein product [Arabidopsis thaliana]